MRYLSNPFTHVAPARGFTLIELLVVMSIAAILIAVGLPNLTSYLSSNRVATASNDFVAALQLARSEAIRRGAPVTLQSLGVAGQGDYGSAGWVMYVDVNGDGSWVAADDGESIRQQGALPAPVSLAGTRSSFGTRVVFDATGRSTNGAGIFVVCYGGVLNDGSSPRSRAAAIAASGRIRVTEFNSSGVPVNDAGSALSSCTNP